MIHKGTCTRAIAPSPLGVLYHRHHHHAEHDVLDTCITSCPQSHRVSHHVLAIYVYHIMATHVPGASTCTGSAGFQLFPHAATACRVFPATSCTTSSQANEVACGFGFRAATSLSCHHVGRVWGLCHGQESRFPTASTCCHVMYSAVRHILYHFNEVCP